MRDVVIARERCVAACSSTVARRTRDSANNRFPVHRVSSVNSASKHLIAPREASAAPSRYSRSARAALKAWGAARARHTLLSRPRENPSNLFIAPNVNGALHSHVNREKPLFGTVAPVHHESANVK